MSSSGIDVWNKKTRALIVEKWYAKGHDSYHVDTTSGRPVVHYVGAKWTDSGDFPTPQAWWGHLDEMAQRLESSVQVTLP